MNRLSRLGFILLSAGSAIGIGNVWRFPYVAGQSGGGCFVAIYLFFLAALGIPVLVMEFAAGRAARHSIVRMHEALTPGKRLWRLHGVLGLLGSVVLMMFYTTVTGWMLVYFIRSAAGAFEGLDAPAIGAAFSAMLADPWAQGFAMAAVCVGASVICSLGVKKGLESASKWMMSSLMVLIVVLAANSLLRDEGMRGVRFLLMPDFGRMCRAGIWNVVINAMNQAFFTLSVGIGCMSIFGSYIDRRQGLLGEAINVTVLDTAVAISAGLIVLPACFAYGVEPGQGPGLVFVTLPNVFNHMPGGRLWGALFFLFMSFAALTTVLATFENIIAMLCDLTGWRRATVCCLLIVAMPLLSLPCVLGFNAWAGFHPLGGASTVLDLEDFAVSKLALPLGAFLFALYCGHRFGWGWNRFIEEANTGTGVRFWSGLRFYCAYVLPVVILVLCIIGVAG